jgi:hypothetical protein
MAGGEMSALLIGVVFGQAGEMLWRGVIHECSGLKGANFRQMNTPASCAAQGNITSLVFDELIADSAQPVCRFIILVQQ